MLCELNEECLEALFGFLDLESQFVMKRVSVDFVPIIDRIWRRTYKKVDLTDETHEIAFLLLSPVQYKDFMWIISNTIQELTIRQCVHDMGHFKLHEYDSEKKRIERLACLKDHKFPKLRKLSCTSDYDLPWIIDLAKVFPALKRLEINWKSRDISDNLEDSLMSITYANILEEVSFLSSCFIDIIDHLVDGSPDIRRIEAVGFNGVIINKIANSPQARRVHSYPVVYINDTQHFIQNILSFVNIKVLTVISRFGNETVVRLAAGLTRLEVYNCVGLKEDFDTVKLQLKKLEESIKLQELENRRHAVLTLNYYLPDTNEFLPYIEKPVRTTKLLKIFFKNVDTFCHSCHSCHSNVLLFHANEDIKGIESNPSS